MAVAGEQLDRLQAVLAGLSALPYYRQALAIAREVGDRAVELDDR